MAAMTNAVDEPARPFTCTCDAVFDSELLRCTVGNEAVNLARSSCGFKKVGLEKAKIPP
jgi:hypothetical protein